MIASHATLKSCKKVKIDTGSLPEKVQSFIYTAVFRHLVQFVRDVIFVLKNLLGKSIVAVFGGIGKQFVYQPDNC